MTAHQTLSGPSPEFARVDAFVRDLNAADVPPDVFEMSALFLLDLVGVGAAASRLDASQIATRHAARHWAAGTPEDTVSLAFDGRPTSRPGCAYALATMIDNLDAHDGWQPSKGHAGAALLPAIIAFAQNRPAISGPEALLNLILGYEVSYRAALALHATVEDYHTSGAWNAIGCASIGARLRGLTRDQHRHALGIAEYHGPRSQMMREIANPTMLHDGSGFGAPVGVLATLLAEDGFTGAPAATLEFDDGAFAWDDLGTRWLTVEQYIKPYPFCRWGHAMIDAALSLRAEHALTPDDIERVELRSFENAVALSMDVPTTSPMAQYSLGWPVAAALVRGRVAVEEVLDECFGDPELRAMLSRITAHADPEIEAEFPARRLGKVSIVLKSGHRLESGTVEASGGPTPPPNHDEVVAKFRAFVAPVLGQERATALETTILNLTQANSDFSSVLEQISQPVG